MAYSAFACLLRSGAVAAATILPVTLAAGIVCAQEIKIVLEIEPDQLDPCQFSRSQVGKVIKQNLVETLTETDPDSGSVKPKLATEWTQVSDNVWRFKLRPNVKFQDGTDFNADAVVFSLNRTLSDKLSCNSKLKYFSGFKIDAKAIDDHTVEFTTDRPVPLLPSLLSTVAATSTKTPAEEITRNPIGTGPYKLAKWTPGQEIVLERVDNYWGDLPAFTRATYVWRPESSVRAAMVASGEADIAANIGLQDATNPKTDFSYLNSETSRLRIDTQIPPLNDIRIRKALNYATDREALHGSIFSDKTLPAAQFVVPGINGFNPDLKPWHYDLEKAQALVQEAKKDGVPVDKEIVIISRANQFPNNTEADAALMAMYKAIGLNVTMRIVESPEWFDILNKPFADGRPPVLLEEQHDNDKGDAFFTVRTKYHSKGNHSTLDDPTLDQMIDEADAATGDKRRELYQQIFKRVLETDVADVYLFHMVGFTRVSPRLSYKPSISTTSEINLSKIKLNK